MTNEEFILCQARLASMTVHHKGWSEPDRLLALTEEHVAYVLDISVDEVRRLSTARELLWWDTELEGLRYPTSLLEEYLHAHREGVQA